MKNIIRIMFVAIVIVGNVDARVRSVPAVAPVIKELPEDMPKISIDQQIDVTSNKKGVLVFLDDSEILHLIRGQIFKGKVEKGKSIPGTSITTDQADSQLRRLLE